MTLLTQTTMPETTESPSVLRDRERLREIVELGLLSPEVDVILVAGASRAAALLGLPIGLVSAVLSDAQHFAATHGLEEWAQELGGTPIEWSFCRHAVVSREPFVVEDATVHPLMRETTLVQEGIVRCYAGVPLITSRGYAVGSLCALGTEARSFSPEEIGALTEIAGEMVRHLEARRVAT